MEEGKDDERPWICSASLLFDVKHEPLAQELLGGPSAHAFGGRGSVLSPEHAAKIARALATWFGVAVDDVHVLQSPLQKTDPSSCEDFGQGSGYGSSSQCYVVQWSVSGEVGSGMLAALQDIPRFDAAMAKPGSDAASVAEKFCKLLAPSAVGASPQTVTNPAVPRRAAEALFDEFDEDRDGELNFEEFVNFRTMLESVPGPRHHFLNNQTNSETLYRQLAAIMHSQWGRFGGPALFGGPAPALFGGPAPASATTPERISKELFVKMDAGMQFSTLIQKQRDVDAIFAQYDRDGDGSWSFDEFQEFLRAAVEAGVIPMSALATWNQEMFDARLREFRISAFNREAYPMIIGAYDPTGGVEVARRLQLHGTIAASKRSEREQPQPSALARRAIYRCTGVGGGGAVANAGIVGGGLFGNQGGMFGGFGGGMFGGSGGHVLYHNSKAEGDFWEGPLGRPHGVVSEAIVEAAGPLEEGWLPVAVQGAGVKYLPPSSFEYAPDVILKMLLADHIGKELGGPTGSLDLRGFWKPFLRRVAPRFIVPANGSVEDLAAFEGRAEIARIKASVTDKATWQAKVYDDAIVEKWLQEALTQAAGVDVEQDDNAIFEDGDRPDEGDVHNRLTTPGRGPRATASLAGLFWQAIGELRASRYFHRFGIAYEDWLISVELRDLLRSQFQAFATEIRADWHPGSGETVMDLVHPSLFPFVSGQSLALGRACRKTYPVQALPIHRRPEHEGLELDRFAHCMLGDEEESTMQWLPAEVDVSASGEARFSSYINNLPQPHALYETLGSVLTQMLPLFEDVVTGPNAPNRVSLRGRRLQVIVKAANYVLKQGKTYEGSWHVEGMQHERIVATGIYYYDQQGAIGSNGIRFRRLRNRNIAGHPIQKVTEVLGGDNPGDGKFSRVTQETSDAPYSVHGEVAGEVDPGAERDSDSDAEDFERVPTGYTHPKYKLEDDGGQQQYIWSADYKSHSTQNFVDLDAVATPEGRVLVFKNSLLHQVQRLYNAGSGVAERKILVFWLVHPDYPIVSSADVPLQQWEEVAPEIAVPLALCLRRHARLAWRVLSYARWGFRRGEADEIRQQLMAQRAASGSKVGGLFTSHISREYSFCEH